METSNGNNILEDKFKALSTYVECEIVDIQAKFDKFRQLIGAGCFAEARLNIPYSTNLYSILETIQKIKGELDIEKKKATEAREDPF